MKNLKPSIEALSTAVLFANKFGVPLISAGDLHDTKSMLRSECIRAIRAELRKCELMPILLVGNHERDNEKSEAHALGFAENDADVISDHMVYRKDLDLYMIPYRHDSDRFLADLALVPDGAALLVHQGALGAEMGEYIKDRSSVDPAVYDRFKVVYSGHYHKHQTIGKLTFLGSPYTITFAEANDPAKGFHILYDDHSIELSVCAIRRHVKLETTTKELKDLVIDPNIVDPKLHLKVFGSTKELSAINKAKLGLRLLGHTDFKLERISTDQAEVQTQRRGKKVGFKDLMKNTIQVSELTEEDRVYTLSVWGELNAYN